LATTQSQSCFGDATCPSAFQLGGGIKSTINASSIFLPNGKRPRPSRRLPFYDSRVDGVLAASTRRRRRRRVVAARREHRCGVATLPSRAGLVELKMTISTTSSQDDVTSRVSVSVECVPFELEGAQCQTPACDQISTFSATIDPRLLETQCPDQTNVTANQEVQLSSHAVQESIKLWRPIVSSIHSSAGYPSWSAWVPSAPASSRPPTT